MDLAHHVFENHWEVYRDRDAADGCRAQTAVAGPGPRPGPRPGRADELGRALDAMWQTCLEKRAFGYSAHYEAVVWTLPDLFRLARPLLGDLHEFERFCRAIPAIVDWLPYDSEEDPWGHTHDVQLYSFRERAAAGQTLDDLLRGFEAEPVSVCPDCGRDLAVEKLGQSHSLSCACGYWVIC